MDIYPSVQSVRSLNGLGTEQQNYLKGDIDRCLNIALLLKKGHIEPCFEIRSKERRGKYRVGIPMDNSGAYRLYFGK